MIILINKVMYPKKLLTLQDQKFDEKVTKIQLNQHHQESNINNSNVKKQKKKLTNQIYFKRKQIQVIKFMKQFIMMFNNQIMIQKNLKQTQNQVRHLIIYLIKIINLSLQLFLLSLNF
ncbi:unnamed protein product [Paramecium sonneborni]|uniref:Transmembrane protein n=1 Tax=Paramecium sonneborni TaxID=65129 RepID=A0A8S1RWI2_9CILI|nr:unnamed protein product [Paramecium sonneborni]